MAFFSFFIDTNIGKGTPQTLCLETHQSGLVSIIAFILSLTFILDKIPFHQVLLIAFFLSP